MISSIIDSNMVIKGELIFEGKVRIDGTIEGNGKLKVACKELHLVGAHDTVQTANG